MDFQNPNSLTANTPPSSGASMASPQSQAAPVAPKFVRSKDRCHILTRTPIYDRTGNLLAYTFRYTAGEGSFRPDMIEKSTLNILLSVSISEDMQISLRIRIL